MKMERRFDMSDFEQSLKDHADQFKMTPSKRVWNGIYNNLHPGSKWPSMTVAILFLFTLITIGNLNNSSFHSNIVSEDPANLSGISKPGDPVANDLRSRKPLDPSIKSSKAKSDNNSISKQEVNNVANLKGKVVNPDQQTIPANNSGERMNNIAEPQLRGATSLEKDKTELNKPGSVKLSDHANAVNQQKSDIRVLNKLAVIQSDRALSFVPQMQSVFDNRQIPVSCKNVSFSPSGAGFIASNLAFVTLTEPVIGSILNDRTAVTSTKLHRKKNDKIEWTYYISPTISTVAFNKKTIQPALNTSSLVVMSNQPSFQLTQTPRFGLEAGAEMSFEVAKRFKLLTGFNLSYSGYNNVSNLVHPTFAMLTLNDGRGGSYMKNYITHYGNGQSQDRIPLVNYAIEASIPLGIKYNIWGNDKIKIDVASLLEPSVLLKGNAYIISTDGRYYVNDPTLVRRTNLDGKLGSYITFIGRKIKWHVGPDFRYQLLSTYKNIYPTKEHLIDYGIRIGISK